MPFLFAAGKQKIKSSASEMISIFYKEIVMQQI
jgi:hypothetical protein